MKTIPCLTPAHKLKYLHWTQRGLEKNQLYKKYCEFSNHKAKQRWFILIVLYDYCAQYIRYIYVCKALNFKNSKSTGIKPKIVLLPSSQSFQITILSSLPEKRGENITFETKMYFHN